MKLEDKIIGIVIENSEDESEVTLHADLERDLGIDSFGVLMIINAIEGVFNITVDEVEFNNIRTVVDIADVLRTRYGVTQ